jgi:hypothetical protein
MEGFAVNIERLEQTSFACPSQWDAWDENGTYYYIRYRWGTTCSLNRGMSL